MLLMSADTPPKTPLKANLLAVGRFTTWNFIYTAAIANDDSRTRGQSYKATVYRVTAKTKAQMIEPSQSMALVPSAVAIHCAI